MFNTETILTLITVLLGGCNIFQVIWWRSERQKHQAEADAATMDVKQKNQEMKQDQYEFIMEKLAKFQNDYMEISEQLKTEARRHIDEISEVERKYQGIINDKCEEMADIKAQLNYFKAIRCYDKDCKHRITNNPKEGKNNYADNKVTAVGNNAKCKKCC